MEQTYLGNSGIQVSRVGLGGHYKAMEEGKYEDHHAYVDKEVADRAVLIQRAIEGGLTYFDTTWRNEVEMLGKTLARLKARDHAVVNGMVLGAFTGSQAKGQRVEDYFNEGLDARLPLLLDGHFHVFMVNAIEEGYDEALCERLIPVLQKRQASGDFDIPGFSCHDPFLARKVADRFPEFRAVMVPYNFHNRKFEQAFAGYNGGASLIAMKPLVWLEYGIPFCAINALPDFETRFGFTPDPLASTLALRFIRANPQISTVICAANSLSELENILLAGEGGFGEAERQVLEAYQQAVMRDSSIPLYLGGLAHDNLRMNYFGALHLARTLGIQAPEIRLNEPGSHAQIRTFAAELLASAQIDVTGGRR